MAKTAGRQRILQVTPALPQSKDTLDVFVRKGFSQGTTWQLHSLQLDRTRQDVISGELFHRTL